MFACTPTLSHLLHTSYPYSYPTSHIQKCPSVIDHLIYMSFSVVVRRTIVTGMLLHNYSNSFVIKYTKYYPIHSHPIPIPLSS